jgi:FkbM family methyltransferase
VAVKRRYHLWVLRHARIEGDAEGVRQLVHGGVALDVGANIGSYTRLLAELADEVIAMEPVPDTFSQLRFNMQSLGVHNVRLLSMAASDRDEPVMMEIPRYRRGPAAWADARIVSQSGALQHFVVPATRIDSLNLTRLDFMKVDVEGHEVAAMRGALATVERFRPAMIVESVLATGDWLYPILKPLGYHGFVWRDGVFCPIKPSERPQNVFFLMPHHIALSGDRRVGGSERVVIG